MSTQNSRNETQYVQLKGADQRRVLLDSILSHAHPVNTSVIAYHLSEYAKAEGISYTQARQEVVDSARRWLELVASCL